MDVDDDYLDDDPGVLPSAAELIRPSNWMHWILSFGECWIFSREVHRFLIGLPFVAAVVTSGLFVWWLRYSSDESMIATYEAAIVDAEKQEDVVRQETYLTALVNLRRGDPNYLFRLGRFLVENGRREGMEHILSLTPNETDGYAPARLWLTDQAVREKPYLPLSEEQIEAQLLKVLKQYPDHTESHRRLAEIYLRKSEHRLAEIHLTQAARSKPELTLLVAKLKSGLKRDPADIERFLQKSAAEFEKRISANRQDVAARLALAETRLLQGMRQEAREELVRGLKQKDHPDLRRALSDLDLSTASQQLTESHLNLDHCLQAILNSIQIDASNPATVRELTKVHTLGAKIPRSRIQPCLDYWQSRIEAEPGKVESQLMLGQLLAIADAHVEAATLLRPLIVDQPNLRLPLAKLLLRAGQTQEGTAILEQLIDEQRERCVKSPADPLETAALAEILLVASRPMESVTLIQQFAEQNGIEISTENSLSSIYGRASLQAYNVLMSDNPDGVNSQSNLSSPEVIGLLKNSLDSPVTAMSAVERLARLSFSSHPQAAQAEQLVNQLRAQGDPEGKILLLMGTHALQSRQYGRAITFLEQANNHARQKDAQILNNLAVALVRSEPSQPGRALEIINIALLEYPDNPDILSTRGEIYIALKKWQEALADLERALPFRRESKIVHESLSVVYNELGNQPLAEEHRKAAESITLTE